MRFLATAALAAISGLCALPASAASITTTIDFTARNFAAYGAYPVPNDPVKGSFTVTIDPTHTYFYETKGVKLNDLDIPYDTSPPTQFNYDPGNGYLALFNQAGGIIPGNYTLVVNPGTGFAYFFYTTFRDPSYGPQGYGIFDTEDLTVAYTAVTPVPAALPLFLSALAAIGAAGLRRRNAI
jgi:hypothetical protein